MGRRDHMDGPNPDHTDVDYDPRYDEVNPQVWALQPYYSIFYNRKSDKKWLFSDLVRFLSFCRVLGVWMVRTGWSLHTIFGPYVTHTLAYIIRKFQHGALKSPFATILNLHFWFFGPLLTQNAIFDIVVTYLMKAVGDQDLLEPIYS